MWHYWFVDLREDADLSCKDEEMMGLLHRTRAAQGRDQLNGADWS